MGKKRSRRGDGKGEPRPVTEETRIRISKVLQQFRLSNDEGTGSLPFVVWFWIMGAFVELYSKV